jgi:hypothetical protein
MSKYSLGLDYGTNSVRALVVEVSTGREVGAAVWNYEHGDAGTRSAAKDGAHCEGGHGGHGQTTGAGVAFGHGRWG